MTGLDSASNDVIRFAEKMAELESKIKKQKLKFWKGKKIISEKEWHKKVEFPTDPDYLQYMPETFIDTVFFFDYPDDEETREARNKWFNDCCEFFKSRKDPKYGKRICEECILNPSSHIESKDIRDLILNFYQEKSVKPTYPCNVCNFFECPYKEGNDDQKLIVFGEIWEIVDSALKYARDATLAIDTAYAVDFDRGHAGKYWFPIDAPTIQICEILDNLHLPHVPVRDINDIYNILVSPEALGNVLEQYIRHLESKRVYDFGNYVLKKSPSKTQIQQLRELKEPIMALFEIIKDTITPEKLHGPYGITFEEEARQKQQEIEDEKKRELGNPDYVKKRDRLRSGSCIVCTKFARIHCINCKTWICVDHWRQHGLQVHSFKQFKRILS